MFSTLSRQVYRLQKPKLIKYQPVLGVNTSAVDKTAQPAGSGKRDLVNYPRIVRQEYAPPVRHFMIPETWFQFFYPKTGVTGPYVFACFFGASLLSKEWVVIEGLPVVFALFTVIGIANHKLGDQIADAYNKMFESDVNDLDSTQEAEKQEVRDTIKALEKSMFPETLIDELGKAKKENVHFQMEAIYRERIQEVYQKVKKQLDFQVEIENVDRRIFQKNLSDYVIRNVLSSITPDQEKNMMQMCISNLNSLSIKA